MRLYLDCDGVLADFHEGFRKIFGSNPSDYEREHGSEKFWTEIANVDGFYRNLPLMPGALSLVTTLLVHRPIILTGVPRGNWAHKQKNDWGRKHFPNVPMVMCTANEKRLYCQPGDILVDDREKHREAWEDAGGIWITHRTANESIEEVLKHV